MSDDEWLEVESEEWDELRAELAAVKAELAAAPRVDAPAVTVEELAEVIGRGRDFGPMAMWTDMDIARAVLELMQRRTVPAAPGSQLVDLARVDSLELALGPHGVVMHPDHVREAVAKGNEYRAWLIEKCGGER